jgi:transcriptional regulator
MSDRADLLQGTLDLLILKSLLLAPLHGWGISKRIRELSREVLQVNQGSLYPALYRLEDRGWVGSEWGTSPEGRRAKFYTLTPLGKKQLTAEQEDWRRFALAIEHVLEGA